MATIYETKNFIVESHEKPEVDRLEGGHIKISPKVEIELDGNLVLRAEPNDGNYAPFQITWNDNNNLSIGVVPSTHSFRIYTKPLDNYKDIQIRLDQKITDSYQK